MAGCEFAAFVVERVALDSKKKRFWKKKGFWLAEISSFQVQLEKFSSKKRICFTEKAFFQLMQDQPIKKSFFQRGKLSISHRNKSNVQQPFSNTACHC